jgi:hypothetical protein
VNIRTYKNIKNIRPPPVDNFPESAPRQLQTGPQQQPERKTQRRSPGRRENDRQQSRRQDRNLATLLFCFLAPASRKQALDPRRLALPFLSKSVFASLTSFLIFLGAHCRPSLSATALKFTLLGYFRKGGKLEVTASAQATIQPRAC